MASSERLCTAAANQLSSNLPNSETTTQRNDRERRVAQLALAADAGPSAATFRFESAVLLSCRVKGPRR